MKRYWLLDYKQYMISPTGKEEIITDWGRIGREFKSLEELLIYLEDYVMSVGFTKANKKYLTVDKDTLVITGTQWCDENCSKILTSEKEGFSTKLMTEAKAAFIQEDEATIEDFAKMNELVEVV